MPSEKILESKKALVAALAEKLKNSSAGVFVDYKGTNVADDTQLRRELRQAGVDYSVVKNTLTRFALKNVGFDALESILSGTTALAVTDGDVVAPAKILCEYAKKHENFTIKAGFVDGEILDSNGVKALAAVPSKEQSLVNLLFVLNGNLRNLAVALQAVADQKGDVQEE